MQLVEVGAAAGLWLLGSIPLSAAACVGQIHEVITKVVVPLGGLLVCRLHLRIPYVYSRPMACAQLTLVWCTVLLPWRNERASFCGWREVSTKLPVISQPWRWCCRTVNFTHCVALCRETGPRCCRGASNACRLHEGSGLCFGEPTSPEEPWAVRPPVAGFTHYHARCPMALCLDPMNGCVHVRWHASIGVCSQVWQPSITSKWLGTRHQCREQETTLLYHNCTMAADGAPWEDHVLTMSQLAQVLQLATSWLSAPQELPSGIPCNTPVTPMEEHSFGDQVCDASAVQCMRRIPPARHVCSALAAGNSTARLRL